MSQGTDMVRFVPAAECAKYSPLAEATEGIMLVYKRDIVPYTFNAYTYSKELFFQRSYRYFYAKYLLSNTREFVSPPLWEVNLVNTARRCYTSYRRVIGGVEYSVYHMDNHENNTMLLGRDDFSSKTSTRYITVKEHYHDYGTAWMYKETCSMNCIFTITRARSRYPYDFFVLSSGVLIDMSPFYDGKNGKTFNEIYQKFFVVENYRMLKDFDVLSEHKTVRKMAFYERPDVVVAWEVEDEKNVTCKLKLWDAVGRAVRVEHDNTFHFVSQTLTATFLTNKQNLSSEHETDHACIQSEAEKKIDEMYNTIYNNTHSKVGGVSYWRTTGGLILAWQELQHRSISALEKIYTNSTNNTATNATSGRRRRSVDIDSHADVTYAQLQFMYDSLRDYINQALSNVAEAWCIDQRRTVHVLQELSKISPSNIISAIYDRPIAARSAGDVIALASCIEVNQETVQVLRDMKRDNGDGTKTCYSRPLVIFNFLNSTEVQHGQLGENNEILLGTYRTEECQTPNLKIFVAGNVGYEYRDYYYTREIDLDTVDIVDTMIPLSINPLENTDFRVLELYSRGELRSANIFNLEDIMREYNMQKQDIKFLSTKIRDDTPLYVKGLEDFMSGLGAVGKGVGMAIGVVGGMVGSFMGGVLSFLRNPFGGMLSFACVFGMGTLVVFLYKRQREAYRSPIDYFFPYATQVTSVTQQTTPPVNGVTAPSAPDISPPPYTETDAMGMLNALKALDEQKRGEATRKKESVKEKKKPSSILDRLGNRRGYRRLRNKDDPAED